MMPSMGSELCSFMAHMSIISWTCVVRLMGLVLVKLSCEMRRSELDSPSLADLWDRYFYPLDC